MKSKHSKLQRLVKDHIYISIAHMLAHNDSFRDAINNYAFEKYVKNDTKYKNKIKRKNQKDIDEVQDSGVFEDLMDVAVSNLEKKIINHIKQIQI